jgi:hypothetical protein
VGSKIEQSHDELIMEIKREFLIETLKAFALSAHGIVIGAPGSGKTYSLRKLKQYLDASNIKSLYLAVDQIGDASEQELKARFKYPEETFVEALRELAVNSPQPQPHILIIDGFDAARDEQKRDRIIWHMRSVMHDLKGIWHVLASVRTYDAKKSPALLSLFQDISHINASGQYRSPDSDISCRHFFVPLLNDDEVKSAFPQINGLESLYSCGTIEFQKLLRLPFNLWLIEKLIDKNVPMEMLSRASSQVQFLNLFWEQRVERQKGQESKRVLLTKIVNDMVLNKALSARKENVYEASLKTEWEELASDEIIQDNDLSRQRVSFTHNILFDYAVSALLIEDNPKELIRFITEDPSRPLFLRPSITFYYTRLWYASKDSFWKSFWYILPSNDPHLKLFARLVPPSVVINEASSFQDLKPLIDHLKKNPQDAEKAILRVLQALRTFEGVKEQIWIHFFKELAFEIRDQYAWDLTTLTSDFLDASLKKGDKNTINDCGVIGRSLLSWALNKRKTQDGKWVDHLTSNFMVPIVAKTFTTSFEESKVLLKRVLELTKEPSFPINYIYRLADHIKFIWSSDSNFVSEIYLTVFEYKEESQEVTHMGGIVLPLMSTRRQDYDMCQYVLIKEFKNYLSHSPLIAIEMGIKLLNSHIIKNEILPYLKKGIELKDTLKTFMFCGDTCNYLPDISYVWDEAEHEDQPIEISNKIFSYIECIATSENLDQLADILKVFRENVLVAYFWRKLLEIGAKYPEVFSSYLFDLCVAEPIFSGSETVYQIGEFLKVAIHRYPKEKRLKIESLILNIPQNAHDDKVKNALEERRNRLLNCLPFNEITSEAAKELFLNLKSENKLRNNEPLVKFSSYSKPFTTDDWLREKGVNLENEENIEIKTMAKKLEDFNSKWGNEKASLILIEEVLPEAESLFEALVKLNNVDAPVQEFGWSALGGCAQTILKSIDELPEKLFLFCREVLLECADRPSEPPKLEYIEGYNSASWSSTPKTEAAQGLPRIAYRCYDQKTRDAVKKLVADIDPSVRYLIAMRLSMLKNQAEDDFWSLIEERARIETNNVVKQGLLYSISRMLFHNKERSIKALDILIPSHSDLAKDSELMKSYALQIMRLAVGQDNEWGIKKLDEIISKPIECRSLLQDVTHDAISEVTPKKVSSKDVKEQEITEKCLVWAKKFINASFEGLEKIIRRNKDSAWTDEDKSILKGLYTPIDTVITRLYFASDVNEKIKDKNEALVSDEERGAYFQKIKPILELILEKCNSENGVLFASSAHYFMEMLNGLLKFDPSGVLHMAFLVAKGSQKYGYNMDSFAIREVVAMVERILADYRAYVQEGDSLDDLLQLLDIFVQVGWAEALRLVWRLDEIYR